MLDGSPLWAPALTGEVVLSTRGLTYTDEAVVFLQR